MVALLTYFNQNIFYIQNYNFSLKTCFKKSVKKSPGSVKGGEIDCFQLSVSTKIFELVDLSLSRIWCIQRYKKPFLN